MAKFLSDSRFAVRGRLMAVDNSGLLGPFFVLRIPPTTFDVQRPASYMDFVLLDTARKTLQKRISLDDELEVIIHAAAAGVAPGTRNEATFQVFPKGQCQKISHAVRRFESAAPINGQVIDNDGQKLLAIDAGVPIVLSLLEHKPSQARQIKVNSWATFWPVPPTHGIILGKL
jgi:hypothetical protein